MPTEITNDNVTDRRLLHQLNTGFVLACTPRKFLDDTRMPATTQERVMPFSIKNETLNKVLSTLEMMVRDGHGDEPIFYADRSCMQEPLTNYVDSYTPDPASPAIYVYTRAKEAFRERLHYENVYPIVDGTIIPVPLTREE